MMGNAITQSNTKIENPKNPCWVAMPRMLIAPARAQPMTYQATSNIAAMAAIMMYWSSVILSVFHKFKHADDGHGHLSPAAGPGVCAGAVYAGFCGQLVCGEVNFPKQVFEVLGAGVYAGGDHVEIPLRKSKARAKAPRKNR